MAGLLWVGEVRRVKEKVEGWNVDASGGGWEGAVVEDVDEAEGFDFVRGGRCGLAVGALDWGLALKYSSTSSSNGFNAYMCSSLSYSTTKARHPVIYSLTDALPSHRSHHTQLKMLGMLKQAE